MMPIFFHLQAHLWIAYLFIFNGLLISCYLRHVSPGFRNLTYTFEASILSAFFVSIALNGLVLLILQLFGLSFSHAAIILPVLSVVLALVLTFANVTLVSLFRVDWGVFRFTLYLMVFIVLFYNGGLIEQITDAWWHMSLANKIAIANSFQLEIGHLDALPTRYYPPLWHGNLALATLMSGESLPILWNSFTAWGGVLKCMSFFLFASVLLSSKRMAFLATLMFVLLPGIGNSFMRVSAWPSHIAYMAWFSLMFVVFLFLNQIAQNEIKMSFREATSQLAKQTHLIISGGVLACIIWFSHQAELLYFFLAFLFYYIGLLVQGVCRKRHKLMIERPIWLVNAAGRAALLVVIFFSVLYLINGWAMIAHAPDLLWLALLPIFTLGLLLWLSFPSRESASGVLQVFALLVCTSLLLLSIDGRHVASLFKPELAYPPGSFNEYPLAALGWFGNELMIPGWHLHLRSGLLYTGIISIPLAIGLSVIKPNRATVFLAANATAAFLFVSSPYLYHWLKEILDYHSPWRIVMLIFHPIIITLALHQCWRWIKSAYRVRNVNV